MKTQAEIAAWLAEVLVAQFEVPADLIAPEALLADDLDLDSIDSIDFMVTLEEKTGMRVEEEELRSLRCFQDMVELVYGKLAAG